MLHFFGGGSRLKFTKITLPLAFILVCRYTSMSTVGTSALVIIMSQLVSVQIVLTFFSSSAILAPIHTYVIHTDVAVITLQSVYLHHDPICDCSIHIYFWVNYHTLCTDSYPLFYCFAILYQHLDQELFIWCFFFFFVLLDPLRVLIVDKKSVS